MPLHRVRQAWKPSVHPRVPRPALLPVWCRLTVAGLEPLTTYVFRIRAFNAFGGSPYCTRHFSTGPAQSDIPAPMVVRCGPDSVTLRWDVYTEMAARMATLQELFDAIDEDGSGCVGGMGVCGGGG
jgi:hypothetical protein